MITYHDWNIESSGLPAQQFDHLSRRLEVAGDLPEGWDWAMLIQVGDAMDIIPLEPMEGGVGHTLTEDQLSLSGYYTMQLRGTQGEMVKHTNIIQVFIPESLSGTGQWPAVPSEFRKVERRIAELNQHPPIPGADGFWMIWNPDTDVYETSGFRLPEVEQDAVQSVNGQTGHVWLTASDIGALARSEMQTIVSAVLSSLPTYNGEVEDA